MGKIYDRIYDVINAPIKENFMFFYLATVIFMVGLSVVFFLKFKLPRIEIKIGPPKAEVETDEKVFFSSLENYIRNQINSHS